MDKFEFVFFFGVGIVRWVCYLVDVVFVIKVVVGLGVFYGDELYIVVVDKDVGWFILYFVCVNGCFEGYNCGLNDSI